MGNSYLSFSAFMEIPAEKIRRARAIVYRESAKIAERDEWGGCAAHARVEQDGVLFETNDFGDPAHAEIVARALVEELEIDQPFGLAWYLCSCSPRMGDSGCGAFLVRRGWKTVWVDAGAGVRKADDARMANPAGQDEALELLRKLEEVISGIEARADELGVDLAEARHWWVQARALLDSMQDMYRELYETFDPDGQIGVHIEYDMAAADALKEAGEWLGGEIDFAHDDESGARLPPHKRCNLAARVAQWCYDQTESWGHGRFGEGLAYLLWAIVADDGQPFDASICPEDYAGLVLVLKSNPNGLWHELVEAGAII
jgi:hypothetical protein